MHPVSSGLNGIGRISPNNTKRPSPTDSMIAQYVALLMRTVPAASRLSPPARASRISPSQQTVNSSRHACVNRDWMSRHIAGQHQTAVQSVRINRETPKRILAVIGAVIKAEIEISRLWYLRADV